jgi:hydroxypyruvate isomerase
MPAPASPPLRFAANLSFLFTERPFFERFAAARAAGFEAVEFHFPYAWDKAALAEVVLTSGIEVILFNLPPGDWDAGERGIACHPGRIAEFQEGVGLAIDYAQALGCRRLNCLAGIAPADCSASRAREILIENLRFAAAVTQRAGIELVMEPLNTRDNPGYLIATTRAGLEIVAAVGSPNLRLQYDIYHAQVMEGDLARTLEASLARIGHIQLADNPGRHEPGSGEINFPFLLRHLAAIGYPGWIGCEYKPQAGTEAGLGWLQPFRQTS